MAAPTRTSPAPTPAPSVPRAAPTPGETQAAPQSFSVSRGVRRSAHRIVIYGTGGIGKTSLAASMNQVGLNPVFIDLERGGQDLDIAVMEGVNNWAQLRSAVQQFAKGAGPTDVPVIDTMTKAEEWCVAYVLANVKTEKDAKATSIESYGYGKGYQHVYEEFGRLLADLDRVFESGKNVVLICHDVKALVPNPRGDDFLRFEPNLYQATSGKSSTRERMKNWCDHLFFLGYDVRVGSDGVAVGGGSRAIYTSEQPTFLAKTRGSKVEPIIVYPEGDATLWHQLFQK